MLYSEKVMDHFQNPRNVGKMDDADGIGEVGNAVCGDIMRMYIKVKDGVITDVKFNTFGCGSAIATSSIATEMIKGKPIEEALKLSNKAVVEALDGLGSPCPRGEGTPPRGSTHKKRRKKKASTFSLRLYCLPFGGTLLQFYFTTLWTFLQVDKYQTCTSAGAVLVCCRTLGILRSSSARMCSKSFRSSSEYVTLIFIAWHLRHLCPDWRFLLDVESVGMHQQFMESLCRKKPKQSNNRADSIPCLGIRLVSLLHNVFPMNLLNSADLFTIKAQCFKFCLFHF